jgi:alkylated DNA repair protein (DNA oxidative demethylase)
MRLADGIAVFPGYLSPAEQVALVGEIDAVLAAAPLFVPTMPRTGRPMSVGMSNCGPLGWVTDKDRGYRYQSCHPVTGRPWPPIPAALLELWTSLAAYSSPPEACLINIYRGAAKMGQHRDQDESDLSAPVLSVSLGDDAVFSIGGLNRKDPRQRLVLRSGDVFLFGGPSRLIYHGVDRVVTGTSQLVSGGGRINLTLRRVTKPVG